jgi:hypothetical protein
MANRQDLHDVVEELPASELGAALRYLRFLCYDGLAEEPVDAETAAKLDAARAEAASQSPLTKSGAATVCDALKPTD